MAEWVIQDMKVLRVEGSTLCAQFEIAYRGQYTGKTYVEYRVRVDDDGTWTCYREIGGRYKQTNGVIEELEPLLYGTIPKAQALAILKG